MIENRDLFKAQRVDNGEWVIGNLINNVFFNRLGQDVPYILCPDKVEYDCFEDFSEGNGIFEVRPKTICRCTGSPDRNGKLIWENDVVKGKYYEKGNSHRHIGYVKYIYNSYKVVGVKQYKGYHDSLNGSYEVLGNIFDNPELLESEE